MNSAKFTDCSKIDITIPAPIKKITYSALYQIYLDSDDSTSDSENDYFEDLNTSKNDEILNTTNQSYNKIRPFNFVRNFNPIIVKSAKDETSKLKINKIKETMANTQTKCRCVDIFVPRM